MPRYFFDLINGIGRTHDEDGIELPDLAAARERAIAEARPIMAHEVLQGRLDLGGRIVIRSASGEVLLELWFDEAVEIEPRRRERRSVE